MGAGTALLTSALPHLPASRSTPYLHVEKVQLHRVPGIHILVRVEELSPQQQRLVLLYALLPQCPPMVQPVHWNTDSALSTSPAVLVPPGAGFSALHACFPHQHVSSMTRGKHRVNGCPPSPPFSKTLLVLLTLIICVQFLLEFLHLLLVSQ